MADLIGYAGIKLADERHNLHGRIEQENDPFIINAVEEKTQCGQEHYHTLHAPPT